jgi:uncharacterized Zn-binding protein involved in type VI secretion
MGKPAARLGDMTAHGGSIVVGLPTVLIGGMPAARVGDMHVCPMLNPGVPPPPHVGGPIMMGSPMVLIGGMPAARMGDMVTCAGPPDTIMLGCMTVLIGEGGSGSAAGGGAGMTAAASAQASAATARWSNLESTTKREHWVEFEVVDKAGLPVSGVAYKFTDSAGKESKGVLKTDGKITRDALTAGNCRVVLLDLRNAQWAKSNANVGDRVKMTAEVDGFAPGTAAVFEVYRRDITGPDSGVVSLESTVQGNKVEAVWEYVLPQRLTEEETKRTRYSSPEYYFDVVVGNLKARSGVLSYRDYLEIKLVEDNGKPIGNVKYRVYLADGTIKEGTLDANGYAKIDKIQPEKMTFAVEPDWNVRRT